jgi:hypothetical protein
MSNNYKGLGSLQHLVKEENRKADAKKNLVEGGEYFKNHTFQDRDSKEHDIDFKTSHFVANQDSVKIDDPMLKPKDEKEVDKLDNEKEKLSSSDNKKAFVDDDLYAKKHTQKGENDNTDEDSFKNIKLGLYGENWYRTLRDYMKQV